MKSEKQKTKGFVIFGQGRSGSNLLRTLLNSHPNLYCDIELFNINRLKREKPVLKYLVKLFPYWYILWNRKKNNDKLYGFKLFVFHLTRIDSLVETLHENGWKFIHIKRENTLKQVFSGAVGNITGKYVRKNQTPAPSNTYNLPLTKIVSGLEKRKNALEDESTILRDIPHLKVSYELELQNQEVWQSTCGKIYNFLGLNPVEVNSSNLVSDPRPDKERIENFDEIMLFLRENGFKEDVDNYFKWL